jgi:hypothetical protein
MKSIPRTLGVNGKNVVTSNLINVNFSIFEKYKNWVQNKNHSLYFLENVMIAQKFKIPHIVDLTNQHWMNKNFPYK